VGGDVTIIMQSHYEVSLDLLSSAALDSLLDAQVEVLLGADVSAYAFRRHGQSILTLLCPSGETLIKPKSHLDSSPTTPAVLCILRRH
jgi:hypothetical protein